MNITHELMAHVFRHVATLHEEIARMQAETNTALQDNVRLAKHLQEVEKQLAVYKNGTSTVQQEGEPQAERHAAVARRTP